jgi:hypothetical protein
MKGFDYRTQQEFDRTVAVLRAELVTIITAGGFRRIEDGETYAHGRDGQILWEAYGHVGVPKMTRKQPPQEAADQKS